MNKNEATFNQLLKEHKSTIYTVCYMFSENREEVEDLFQEICIRLWNGLNSFRQESNIRTWVWRVATNTCITWQKKSERQHLQLAMSVDLFDRQKEETAQIRILYNRIHRLELLDRAIVLLWLENMSYEEIAQICGLTVKNVSVRLVRIKEQLKKMSDL